MGAVGATETEESDSEGDGDQAYNDKPQNEQQAPLKDQGTAVEAETTGQAVQTTAVVSSG